MDAITLEQTRRERLKKFDQYQVSLYKVPALLGLGDTAETVRVPGYEATTAYVRLGSDGEQEVDQVLNLRVPFIHGMPVYVGYDPVQPTIFQVLTQRQSEYIESGQGHYPNVAEHGSSHAWAGTGYDLAWIAFEQVTPLMVRAEPDLGAFWISVYEGQMPRKNGFVFISAANGNTVTLDLSGDVPVAGGLAALIYLDSDGNVQRRLSSTVPTASLDITLVPKPNASEFALAWARLYAGQTALNDTYSGRDIMQLRFPQYNVAGDDQGVINNRKLIEMGW